MCKVVSKDCLLKVKRIENSITSLLQDLAGIVTANDHQDIASDLLKGYNLAIETKYAEKVLRRNKNAARGASKPPPKTKQQRQMASLRKQGNRSDNNRPSTSTKGKKRSPKQVPKSSPKDNSLKVVNKEIAKQIKELKATLKRFNINENL